VISRAGKATGAGIEGWVSKKLVFQNGGTTTTVSHMSERDVFWTRDTGKRRFKSTSGQSSAVGEARKVYCLPPDTPRRLARFDVSPQEVWEALDCPERVTRNSADGNEMIYGVTSAGRHLMVLIIEYAVADEEWEILVAWDMTAEEIKRYERLIERPP
jgi:hypothetical protein